MNKSKRSAAAARPKNVHYCQQGLERRGCRYTEFEIHLIPAATFLKMSVNNKTDGEEVEHGGRTRELFKEKSVLAFESFLTSDL